MFRKIIIVIVIMATWKVTMRLHFIRTNDEISTKQEPNPTQKQLNAYMRKGSKYKLYLADMYSYGDYNKMPSKIKYSDGGTLSFELSGKIKNYSGNPVFPSKKSVIDDILGSSFEDGMYESGPGSAGVYPTKKKYLYNGMGNAFHHELGVIDCRNKATITVEKVEIKKKSRTS